MNNQNHNNKDMNHSYINYNNEHLASNNNPSNNNPSYINNTCKYPNNNKNDMNVNNNEYNYPHCKNMDQPQNQMKYYNNQINYPQCKNKNQMYDYNPHQNNRFTNMKNDNVQNFMNIKQQQMLMMKSKMDYSNNKAIIDKNLDYGNNNFNYQNQNQNNQQQNFYNKNFNPYNNPNMTQDSAFSNYDGFNLKNCDNSKETYNGNKTNNSNGNNGICNKSFNSIDKSDKQSLSESTQASIKGKNSPDSGIKKDLKFLIDFDNQDLDYLDRSTISNFQNNTIISQVENNGSQYRGEDFVNNNNFLNKESLEENENELETKFKNIKIQNAKNRRIFFSENEEEKLYNYVIKKDDFKNDFNMNKLHEILDSEEKSFKNEPSCFGPKKCKIYFHINSINNSIGITSCFTNKPNFKPY